MKKFLLLIMAMFVCGVAFADTINIHWLNDDGTMYENTTCTVDGDLELPTPPTKTGYTFAGWELLPYTRIEYLESTGTQWIDTGVIGTDKIKVEVDYQFTGMVDVHKNRIYGAGSTNSSNALHFAVYNSKFITAYNSELASTYFSDLLKHKLIQDKNVFTLDGAIINTHPITTFSTPKTMRLFAVDVGNIMYYGVVRIYSYRVYDNDTLVRDFIPVLDKNSTPCMYDLVEEKYYYNAGTGQFIAGPVLQ